MIWKRRHLYTVCLALLSILLVFGFYFYNQPQQSNYLKVVFLDVGQGDSIYIEAPNGRQVLIDGGPDGSIISELPKIMPLFDRSIDLVVATHADADHIGGLVTVLDSYEVSRVMENGAGGKTKLYQNFEKKIIEKNIQKITAEKGMHIILDDKENIYFDVLYPDRDVSKLDSNDGSIVGRLVYGNESFMLTGDAPLKVENTIIANESTEVLKSSVLKLGHHGSHTSSGSQWLTTVQPQYAVVSAGLNNRYGHPHKDILVRLKELSIPYLATYEKGDIVFESDGVSLWQN